MESLSPKERRQRAGHQEILGETLAKFEFFQQGWHPYSRFLDVDKVDLVLRRRVGDRVAFREIQVKFGKLYRCTYNWEQPLFSVTSWRFFSEKNLEDMAERPALFLAYVLSEDDRYESDMFIFPISDFVSIVRKSEQLGNGNYRVYISKTNEDDHKWYVRRLRRMEELNDTTVVDVTSYYRNFAILE